MTDTTTVIARLDELRLSPLNPRTQVDEEEIDQLADSIEMLGLMQNLSGFRRVEQDGIEIVAGGRRLRALQRLAQRDWVTLPEIRVQVTEDPDIARQWALAEATSPRALHPADEVRGYARMRDAGNAGVSAIARAFAVTEARVRQRLRLATLPASVIDELAADRLSLDQCAAFCVSDDIERIERLLPTVIEQDWHASRIRNDLMSGHVRGSDRRAIFAGADYRAAGGSVIEDLFQDETWFLDEARLQRAFDARLADAADEVRATEPWAFVWHTTESHPRQDARTEDCELVAPDPIDLPEADAAELNALLETPSWQRSADEDARLEELTSRARGSFTEDQMRGLGVILYVDRNGDLRRLEGLCLPAPAGTDADEPDNDTGDDGPDTPAPAAAPTTPHAVLEDLDAVRLHALQSALLDKPALLLDLLAWQIDAGIHYARPIGVHFDSPRNMPSFTDHLLASERLDRPLDRTGAPTAASLAAFREKGTKHRNDVLTTALARAVHSRRDAFGHDLMRLAGADIRAIWTPTAQTYFARLRGPALDAILAELLPDDEDAAARFAALKVRDKAAFLGRLFNDAETQESLGLDRATRTRIDTWLPPELRAQEDDA